jgi:hypothetical protein
MFDSLKSKVARLGIGWYWPLVLLALPACFLDATGLGTLPEFDPGQVPLADAIMCDIRTAEDPRCASQEEIDMGVRLEDAAIALTSGQHGFALDFASAEAQSCPLGAMVVPFHGDFPNGLALCLNCGQQLGPSSTYVDANAACVAKCKDLMNNSEIPAPGGIDAFCASNAHVSTNFPLHSCFEGACSDGGTFDLNYPDPRRNAELIMWNDTAGTSAAGNNLTRTAAEDSSTGTPPGFNAGAWSGQPITSGSAFVDFEAGAPNLDAILGVSFVSCVDPQTCPDSDASAADIDYGITLHADGNFYVIEKGVPIATPFGTYSQNDIFRIRVIDQLDGNALIEYATVPNACIPGQPCPDNVFHTSSTLSKYPLRVDASIRKQNSTLQNVTIVRIQEQQ